MQPLLHHSCFWSQKEAGNKLCWVGVCRLIQGLELDLDTDLSHVTMYDFISLILLYLVHLCVSVACCRS